MMKPNNSTSVSDESQFVESKVKMWNDDKMNSSIAALQEPCHLEVFRAYDRLYHLNNTFLFGIAETQLCIASIKSSDYVNHPKDYAKMKNLPIKSVNLPLRFHKSAYPFKISSCNIVNDAQLVSPLTVSSFDESGFTHKFKIPFNISDSDEIGDFKIAFYNPSVKKETRLLNPDDVNYTQKDVVRSIPENYIENFRRKLASFDTSQELSESLQMSYIEAITKFNGSIYYTSGLNRMSYPGINFLSKNASDSILPVDLVRMSFVSSVLALEIFEAQNLTHYHIVHHVISTAEDDKAYSLYPTYKKCTAESIKKPSFRAPEYNGANCTTKDLAKIPIDIVSWKTDKCERLITFFNYVYQVNRINETIFDDPLSINHASWIPSTVNAVMVQGETFYLFHSGNVLVTIQARYSSDCNTINANLNSAREYQSSELLRIYGHDHLLKDNKASKFTYKKPKVMFLDYTLFDGKDKFSPALEGPKDIPLELQLTPDGRPMKKASSMGLAFTILIAFVILLLGCLFYYTTFYRNSNSTDGQSSSLRRGPRSPGIRATKSSKSLARKSNMKSVRSPNSSVVVQSPAKKSTVGGQVSNAKATTTDKDAAMKSQKSKLSHSQNSKIAAQPAGSKVGGKQ